MPTTRTRTTKTAAAKPAAKKTTPRKTAATKPTPTVDLRKPLPHRTTTRSEFITEPQILAAHALATAGLRLPIRPWTTNGDHTATLHWSTGAHLHHNPNHDTPLTAITPCARGAHHTHPIRTAADLGHATQEAHACRAHHGGPNQWPAAVHLRPLTPALTPADLPEPAVRHDQATTHEIDLRPLLADKEHPEEPEEEA